MSNVPSQKTLRPSLKLMDLVFLGIGSIVGVGIFVVAGVTAATTSGPAVVLSFVIAGLASLFTALAYAELASCLGGSGGANGYVQRAFGKSAGWVIGWVLLFEYAIAAAYLAMAWSGYLVSILESMGIHLPSYLRHSIIDGGIINLPAVAILAWIGFLLFSGTRKSVRLNLVFVSIKLITILAFIVVAAKNVQPGNWDVFVPFGYMGVMHGAALVFNAFVGFDILTSAAEDTENPRKNLPLSIMITFVVSIALYVLVAGLLTGIAHYTTLNSPAAITEALVRLRLNWVATAIGMGAIISIGTVLFGFLFALTRLIFALSRKGHLPARLATIHPKNNTPYVTVISACVALFVLTEIVPLEQAIKLINFGSLFAYSVVCFGVIRLRRSEPLLKREFRLPLNPLIPLLGAAFCIYLMFQLPWLTWVCFLLWIIAGLVVHMIFHKTEARSPMPFLRQFVGSEV